MGAYLQSIISILCFITHLFDLKTEMVVLFLHEFEKGNFAF